MGLFDSIKSVGNSLSNAYNTVKTKYVAPALSTIKSIPGGSKVLRSVGAAAAPYASEISMATDLASQVAYGAGYEDVGNQISSIGQEINDQENYAANAQDEGMAAELNNIYKSYKDVKNSYNGGVDSGQLSSKKTATTKSLLNKRSAPNPLPQKSYIKKKK